MDRQKQQEGIKADAGLEKEAILWYFKNISSGTIKPLYQEMMKIERMILWEKIYVAKKLEKV